LHPGNNSRATAAVHIAGHRIIDDNYRRLFREPYAALLVVITIHVESAGLSPRLNDFLPSKVDHFRIRTANLQIRRKI